MLLELPESAASPKKQKDAAMRVAPPAVPLIVIKLGPVKAGLKLTVALPLMLPIFQDGTLKTFVLAKVERCTWARCYCRGQERMHSRKYRVT